MKANYTTSEGISIISTGEFLWIQVDDKIYVVNNPDGALSNSRSIFIDDIYNPGQAFQKIRIWDHRLRNMKRQFDFDDSHPLHITMGGIKFPKKTWAEWRDTTMIVDENGELQPYKYWLFTHPHIPGDGLIIREPDFEAACQQAKKWFDKRQPA